MEIPWTTIFLFVFILAFFPNQFNQLIYLPITLLTWPFTSSSSSSSTPLPPNPSIPTYCTPTPPGMSWFQKTLSLPASGAGSYLVTSEITSQLPELSSYKVGILHLFMQHTSAALSLNENYDEDVRTDMSAALDRIVPEDRKGTLYRHSAEGLDDMPAHVKAALVGVSVSVPIKDGRLNLGTWQGIWYLEFRKSRHSRKIVATINGEKK